MTRLDDYVAYMDQVRAEGRPIVAYEPPCGCPAIETEAPDDADVWDTLSTCPHCGDLHYKVVYFDHAEGYARP